MSKLLFNGSEWTTGTLEKMWKAIEKLNKEKYQFTYYEPQVEIITKEHMLNLYSTNGLPSYNHWSYGKTYMEYHRRYNNGRMNLAYEIVVNTDPCIVYLMESNTAVLQLLTLAHAGIGHNTFFKNNYLFKDNTQASYILDYMSFARNFIRRCEIENGTHNVENLLSLCHVFSAYGVDRYKRNKRKNPQTKQEPKIDDLWRIFDTKTTEDSMDEDEEITYKRGFPEENILYFIEKNSPNLRNWEREVIRIVRKIAQYFEPQRHTKLINEGTATFIHYLFMNDLYDRKLLNAGSMLEFIQLHAGVCSTPKYINNEPINPYALGFAMFKDIKRVCENPTDEDYLWLPSIAGKSWLETFKNIIENYRDESFISQCLSPKIIRDFKFGTYKEEDDHYLITNVHDNLDMQNLRESISREYLFDTYLPKIEIIGTKQAGRVLEVAFTAHNGSQLNQQNVPTLKNVLQSLWNGDVNFYNFDTITTNEEDGA